MNFATSHATLKVDALGVLAATACTAVALGVVFGPSLLAQAAPKVDQAAILEQRKRASTSLDRENDAAKTRLADLTALETKSVHLVPASRINERLGDMTILAAKSGASITQMNQVPTPVGAGGTDAKHPVVPIRLAGSATYSDVTKFVRALHEQFRDTAVTGLNITAPAFTLPPAPAKTAGSTTAAAAAPVDNTPKAAFSIDLAWFCAPANSDASAGSAAPEGAASKP